MYNMYVGHNFLMIWFDFKTALVLQKGPTLIQVENYCWSTNIIFLT